MKADRSSRGFPTDRQILHDWGETFALAVLAGTVPILIGWTVRSAWQAMGPSVGTEAHARDVGSIVVLIVSPVFVGWLAWRAARRTKGQPMLRALAVGLAPGLLALSVAAKAAILSQALPGLNARGAIGWGLINLVPAAIAGVAARGARRRGRGSHLAR